jgi:hypothetical protein
MSNPPSTLSTKRTNWRSTVAQWWCGVFAHELTVVIQSSRISVRCRHCGFESSGWAVTAPTSSSLSHSTRTVKLGRKPPATTVLPLAGSVRPN